MKKEIFLTDEEHSVLSMIINLGLCSFLDTYSEVYVSLSEPCSKKDLDIYLDDRLGKIKKIAEKFNINIVVERK